MERFESEFQNDLEEINSHQCMYRDLYHHVVKLERSSFIFDLGSETVKCGYSCESYPFICEPTSKFFNTNNCKKEFNVMYRVQYDSSNKWVFICKVCLEKLKPNNPHYRYGGTWKK